MFGKPGMPPLPAYQPAADCWRDHEFGQDTAADIEAILDGLLLQKMSEALQEAPQVFAAMASDPAYSHLSKEAWDEALREVVDGYGDTPLISEYFDDKIRGALSL
ncbi:hypothetical protein [Nonomuraea sp. SBT364]|uniref:hypothetical protein n=1 Tax=Nonomuraea sp. SBT364 TaxID=1580530 RepID=UPI00066DEF71|nr:hypothetical protein [Nonomuraea sp. SBT364]